MLPTSVGGLYSRSLNAKSCRVSGFHYRPPLRRSLLSLTQLRAASSVALILAHLLSDLYSRSLKLRPAS